MKALLFLLALSTGCDRWFYFDPSTGTALDPSPCVSEARGGLVAAAVSAGAHAWDPLGGHFQLGGAGLRHIRVICGTGSDDGGAAEWTGEFDGDVVLAERDWDPTFSDDEVRTLVTSVVAHELGHAAMMVHEADPLAVMYPYASTVTAPDATDAQQLCSIWPQTCGRVPTDSGLWPDEVQ